jgi:hypothetical protein
MEPVETVKETYGYVRLEWANSWLNCVLDDNDGIDD